MVRIKKRKKSITDSNTLFAKLSTAPSLIGMAVFFIIPFFAVIYYSLVDNPISKEFVGFENFKAIVGNGAFKIAVKNTAVLSLITVPPAVIVSMLLAMLMESSIPAKSMFRSMLLSPVMVPAASVVLIWQVVFHYNGTLNAWIGGEKVDWLKTKYALIVIALLFLWKNLGYNMILFLSALGGIPRDLIEVAELEGAGRIYRFFHIKLRYISPTIIFVTILSMINSFKLFREVYLLTGDYPYEGLYLLQHYMNNTFRTLDYQKLSSAAIIMMLVMAAIVGVLILCDSKFGEDIEE